MAELPGKEDQSPPAATLDRYAAGCRSSAVVAVDGPMGTVRDGRRIGPPPSPSLARRFTRPGDTWLDVQTSAEPLSSAGTGIVRAVRGVRAGVPTLVTSEAADAIDTEHTIASRLPLALLLAGITTFVVLMLMTGSVLIAAKALMLSALSLTAIFGAIVFIFQEGHLRWLVGNFTVTGSINVLNPRLVFCIAFGLAMDYEVFMLSRVKEDHDRGSGNREAVALGLQRTGPIITAGTAVMAIVFVSYATSAITSVKLIGVALAIAVVADVTIVRRTLVAAVTRLIGRLNWWQPAPLRWLRGRVRPGDAVLGDPVAAPGFAAD